ncbi:MAG: MarR family winged helix-turn-helix transcriptional regulator [Minwuia sp.]|uniref:MarR family winged helix-turn-helix transcriptional regulator n=1 Tax=Minwuia sp. TaxID=2493630 RepID=UPI003A89F3B7
MTTDPLDRNLEFLISDLSRLLKREFGRRMRDMDLTRSQWWVMVHLIRYDGCNQTQLADELDIGKVALGGLLDRLEARGWVERRPDPDDRRAKRVFLTDRGRPLITEMQDRARDVHRQMVGGLDRNEQDELVRLLMRAKGNFAAGAV